MSHLELTLSVDLSFPSPSLLLYNGLVAGALGSEATDWGVEGVEGFEVEDLLFSMPFEICLAKVEMVPCRKASVGWKGRRAGLGGVCVCGVVRETGAGRKVSLNEWRCVT